MLEAIAISAGALAALSASALSLRKIGQQVSEAMQRQHKINALLEQELSPNHGSSLKDQVTRMEVRLLEAKEDVLAATIQVSKVQTTLDEHLVDLTAHQHDPSAHVREDDIPDAGGAGPRSTR